MSIFTLIFIGAKKTKIAYSSLFSDQHYIIITLVIENRKGKPRAVTRDQLNRSSTVTLVKLSERSLQLLLSFVKLPVAEPLSMATAGETPQSQWICCSQLIFDLSLFSNHAWSKQLLAGDKLNSKVTLEEIETLRSLYVIIVSRGVASTKL